MDCLTLIDLLSNSIVLRQTCPYLPISGLLNLAATCKAFHNLVFSDSGTFRHLDISTAKGARVDIAPIDRGGINWRSQRIDESTTEDDFYGGPLRGIFSRLKRSRVLAHVQTLILDGASAPAEILREIICHEPYQVRILSVIGSTNLNERKFQQALRYAVRLSRPSGMPKLKGVYVFGMNSRPSLENLTTSVSVGVTNSPGAQLGASLNIKSPKALQSCFNADVNPWYRNSGKVLPRTIELQDWAKTLKVCEDVIAFDAVLCRGPRHDPANATPGETGHEWLGPNVASIALKGCEICHTLPEGPAISNEAPSSRLPLLLPVLKHSSSIKVAQTLCCTSEALDGKPQCLYTRCAACCLDRWCEGCGKFWCENHYEIEHTTYTHMQAIESMEPGGGGTGRPRLNLKVHLGLCVERCLVNELIQGSDGMWS